MIHFKESRYGTEFERYVPQEYLSRNLKLGDVEDFECLLAGGKLHLKGTLTRAQVARLTQEGECALFYCHVPDSQVEADETTLIPDATLEVTSIVVFVTTPPEDSLFFYSEITDWIKKLNSAQQ